MQIVSTDWHCWLASLNFKIFSLTCLSSNVWYGGSASLTEMVTLEFWHLHITCTVKTFIFVALKFLKNDDSFTILNLFKCNIGAAWIFTCNHAIIVELWHIGTLTYGHTPIAISSPWGECMPKSAADSTTFNDNFVHQVVYIMSQSIQIMITLKGPRMGFDLRTVIMLTV